MWSLASFVEAARRARLEARALRAPAQALVLGPPFMLLRPRQKGRHKQVAQKTVLA